MIDFKPARSALDILFAVPDCGGGLTLPAGRFFVLLSGLLDRLSGRECNAVRPAGVTDYLNALELEFGSENVAGMLLEECFEAVIRHRILPAELLNAEGSARFLLEKILELCSALKQIPESLLQEEKKCVLPSALELFSTLPSLSDPEPFETTAELLSSCDRFKSQRVFKYVGGKLIPSVLQSASRMQLNRFQNFSDSTESGRFLQTTFRILPKEERIFLCWFTVCPVTAKPV